MAVAELYHIERLRALRGDALVTYPYGSVNYKQCERVYSVERSQAETAFLAADGEFTGTKLTAQRIVGGDAVYVEIYQRYETLPGPAVTTVKFDAESGVLITTTRTRMLLADMSPGESIDGTTRTIKEKQPDGDSTIVGWEVAESIPQATAHSLATALEEEDDLPYQFPARADFDIMAGFTVPIGYREPFSTNVPHYRKTWWVVSATKPTIVRDGITYGDTIYLDYGVTLKNCIHNAITLTYTTGGPVHFYATIPSLNTYTSVWIPGDPRLIKASITRAGSKYRWKVVGEYVQPV